MVPLDQDTFTNLCKHLPPGKAYGKNVRVCHASLYGCKHAATDWIIVGCQTGRRTGGELTEPEVHIPTNQFGDRALNFAMAMADRPPCYAGHDGPALGHLTFRLRNDVPLINVLIDIDQHH